MLAHPAQPSPADRARIERSLPATAAQVRRVEQVAWAVCVVTIAVHCWLYRFEMVNLDGISYLELGHAWRDGRWADALNGYWSPAYPWLLAVALALANPSPYWEYPLVHVVNALSACAALAAFAYLVRGFGWARHGDEAAAAKTAAAYALFLWSAIVLLVTWMESPDMLLAAFIYLAAGALVRLDAGNRRVATAATFGAALGLAYLTKAVMMPIAAGFFAAAWVSLMSGEAGQARLRGRGSVRAARALLPALAAFLLLASPWVTALSLNKGRFTFGDSGAINYVWFVNGSEDWPRSWPVHWPHWSGEAGNGVAIHPARRLNADPAVYEFATPVAGTYPMWFDPSWWYEGVHPHLDAVDQIRRFKISLGDLYRIFALSPYNRDFFNPQPALVAVIAVIVAAARRLTGRPVFAVRWALWVPPLAAIALYSAVYVEPRYLGAFVALLWVVAIDAVRPTGIAASAALHRIGAIAIACVAAAAVIAATWVEAYPAARRVLRGESDRVPNAWNTARRVLRGESDRVPNAWNTAERIRAAGIQPGDRMAIAGNAQVATRWAHLLRARIVAEVPVADASKLWHGASGERDAVEAALRSTEARWLLLDQPDGNAPAGWRRIDGTPFVLKGLR
jgi:hypothetical protein